ncbi:MAG: hypothetical protein AAFX99_06180 [Myxococcota bacterium]
MTTAASTRRLLFVCTGNLHRSVMAAAIAGGMFEELGDQGPHVLISSASALGLHGRPAPPEVVTVCAELGLDVSHHRSQPLTRSLIQHANQIIVMADVHAGRVLELDPDAEPRILHLGDYHEPPGDIHDPIGESLEGFRASRDGILAALQRLLPELL